MHRIKGDLVSRFSSGWRCHFLFLLRQVLIRRILAGHPGILSVKIKKLLLWRVNLYHCINNIAPDLDLQFNRQFEELRKEKQGVVYPQLLAINMPVYAKRDSLSSILDKRSSIFQNVWSIEILQSGFRGLERTYIVLSASIGIPAQI